MFFEENSSALNGISMKIFISRYKYINVMHYARNGTTTGRGWWCRDYLVLVVRTVGPRA